MFRAQNGNDIYLINIFYKVEIQMKSKRIETILHFN